MLSFAASLEEFVDVWRWRDWNELWVRTVGAIPVITAWASGMRIAELDMARMAAPNECGTPRVSLGRSGPLKEGWAGVEGGRWPAERTVDGCPVSRVASIMS